MVNSSCSVRGCRGRRKSHPGLKFYRFPKIEKYNAVWKTFCDSRKPISPGGAICSVHFEDKFKIKNQLDLRYNLTAKGTRDITEDAIPTLHGPTALPETPMEVETNAQGLHSSFDEPMDTDSPQLLTSASAASTSFGSIEQEWLDGVTGENAQLSVEELTLKLQEMHKQQRMEMEKWSIERDRLHEENRKLLEQARVLEEAKEEIYSNLQPYITDEILQNEWDHLKEANNSLALEKAIMRMEGEKLKRDFAELAKDYGELEERTKEAEGVAIHMQHKLKGMRQMQRDMKLETQRLNHDIDFYKGKNEKYEAILEKFFTPGQLRRLMGDKSNSRLRWSNEDIASAISLRCASIKGYRYLRYKRFWPLPHVRTLRRWAAKVYIEEGIMDTVFTLLEEKGKSMSETERLVGLSFDEMSIDHGYCLDKATDTVYGEVNKVQVVMARGLTTKWKQPLAYYFDRDMSKEMLFEILERLYNIGFTAVSITSDLGGQNRSFLKEVQVTNEYVYFKHPSDKNLKVFVFADAPHLIKLARNHFLDEGYILDGTEIRTDVIEKLLEISRNEVTAMHRLSQVTHLDVTGSRRQRVRPAARLMSQATALSIDHCCRKGYMTVRNHEVVCKLFDALGRFFTIFNNLDKKNTLEDSYAYGQYLQKQDAELDEIKEVIQNIRQIKTLKSGENTNALLPFQKGMMMSIKALQEMYVYLRDRYDIKYILTRRLNQDSLENFFGYIRGMGGRNDHPLPTDFKWRMKLYILGKHHSAVFTVNRNTEEIVDEECLITPSKTFSTLPSANERTQSSAPLAPAATPCTTSSPNVMRTPQHNRIPLSDAIAELSTPHRVAFPTNEKVTLHTAEEASDNGGDDAHEDDDDDYFVDCTDSLLLAELGRIELAAEEAEAAKTAHAAEAAKSLESAKAAEVETAARGVKAAKAAEAAEAAKAAEAAREADAAAAAEEDKDSEAAKEERLDNEKDSAANVILEQDENAKEEEEVVDEILNGLRKEDNEAAEKLEGEGFVFLAGYVAHRYRTKYTHLGEETKRAVAPEDSDWLQVISKGSMIRPTSEFVNVLQCVEATFVSVHGTDKQYMRKGKNAISGVLEKARHELREAFSEEILRKYPLEVIKCFIRVRTYIRIRYCNERLKAANLKKYNEKKFNNKSNKLGDVKATEPEAKQTVETEDERQNTKRPKKDTKQVAKTKTARKLNMSPAGSGKPVPQKEAKAVEKRRTAKKLSLSPGGSENVEAQKKAKPVVKRKAAKKLSKSPGGSGKVGHQT